MSDFGILESQYRLIETRFLDDWVIFKAFEVATGNTVCIRTPNDRLGIDSRHHFEFRTAAARLDTGSSASARYYPAGSFDQHDYLVTPWIDGASEQFECVDCAHPVHHDTPTESSEDLPLSLSTPPCDDAATQWNEEHSGLVVEETSNQLELHLPGPGQISGPQRVRENRSMFPAFATVAILLLMIAGGWYWWQFEYLKKQADTALTAVVAAREAAQVSEAGILAADVFSRAEHQLSAMRRAYDDQRYGAVVGVADVALADYALAGKMALERGLRETRKHAMDVYATVNMIEGVDTTRLNSHLQTIRSQENVSTHDAALGARSTLVQVAHKIEVLGAEALARTLFNQLSQLDSEVRALNLAPGDPHQISTTRQIQAARDSLLEGNTTLASIRYENARAHVRIMFDAANWRSLGALREQVERLRQVAISSGADTSAGFAEAEAQWQVAMDAWEGRDVAQSESALRITIAAFESLVAEQRTLAARDEANRVRDRLLVLEDLPAVDRDVVETLMVRANTQYEANNFHLAAASFAAATERGRSIGENLRLAQIEQLHSKVMSTREQADSHTASESVHYRQARAALHQAHALMKSDQLSRAQPSLEQAHQQFVLAIKQTSAKAAEQAMNEAREASNSLGLPSDNALLAKADTTARAAYTAFSQANYDHARAQFSLATVTLKEVLENTRRLRAEQAGKQLRLDQSEGEMRNALAGALAVGVSAELGGLAVGHSHRRMGETLRNGNHLDAARDAFEAATVAFEQAVLVEIERRALRAKDLAVAVRTSAAKSGAAPLSRFSKSNLLFDQASADLVRGNHQTAYEVFRLAQAGFDQAALEWSATQARAAADSALAAASVAGVSNQHTTVYSAMQAFERGDQLLSRQAFADAMILFVDIQQTLQALLKDLVTSEVMQARDAAVVAKEQLPGNYPISQLSGAEHQLARALEAQEAGQFDLAISRFNSAEDGFDSALVQAGALKAQSIAANSHLAVDKLGARDSDALLAQGKAREQAGAEHLQLLRFVEAKEMFVQAEESFARLGQYLAEQTRRFVAGSTPEEIARAMALCDTHVTGCVAQRYRGETHREVHLRPFAIDDHEVTNEEFAQFVRSAGFETDAERLGYAMRAAGDSAVKAPGYSWRSPAGRGTNHLRFPTHPVVNVSLEDASAFCRWSGGRLPLEAEWEYAARGEQRRQFPWGDEWQADVLRWGGDPSAGPMECVGMDPDSRAGRGCVERRIVAIEESCQLACGGSPGG